MAPVSRCQTGFMMWVWGCQLPGGEGPKVWECHCKARRHTTSTQLRKHCWWGRQAFDFVFVFVIVFAFVFVFVFLSEFVHYMWVNLSFNFTTVSPSSRTFYKLIWVGTEATGRPNKLAFFLPHPPSPLSDSPSLRSLGLQLNRKRTNVKLSLWLMLTTKFPREPFIFGKAKLLWFLHGDYCNPSADRSV